MSPSRDSRPLTPHTREEAALRFCYQPHHMLLLLLCVLVSGVPSSAFLPAAPWSLPRSASAVNRAPSHLSWKAEFDVFFDIAIRDEAAGRLIFHVTEENLPKTVENFRALVTGERASLDSALSYKKCAFEYSSMYTLGAQYKWSHVCKGRGKNIFGKDKQPVKEPSDVLSACRHACPGSAGSYYGMNVESLEVEDTSEEQTIQLQLQKPLGLLLEENDDGNGVFVANVNADGSAGKDKRIMTGDQLLSVGDTDIASSSLDDVMGVIADAKSTINLRLSRDAATPGGQASGNVLAVPLGGPGSGYSRFDIIRVRDSPQEWRERMLQNSAVLGYMRSGCSTIRNMAAAAGEPVIVDCGVL